MRPITVFALTVLTALLIALGHATDVLAPAVLVSCAGWGVAMYWQHDWLTRQGMAEMATPCVLTLGAVLAFIVALAGDWPLFVATASVPVQVWLLRMVRTRLPQTA